jgi:hypothetical protein
MEVMVLCARSLLERTMSTRFRLYYPEQRYLLPPSPSDWLTEGHLDTLQQRLSLAEHLRRRLDRTALLKKTAS